MRGVKPLMSTKSVVAANLPRRFPAENWSRMNGGTRLLTLFLVGFSFNKLSISVVRIVVVKVLCIFKRLMLSGILWANNKFSTHYALFFSTKKKACQEKTYQTEVVFEDKN